MGKVEWDMRTHAIFLNGKTEYPYTPICREASRYRDEEASDSGENGTALRMPARSASMDAILEMVKDCMATGNGLSRSSSSLSLSDAGMGRPQLKYLDSVRTQSGIVLTWTTKGYMMGRAFMPLPRALLSVVEDRVQPFVVGLSQQGEKALFAVDATVELMVSGLVNSAEQFAARPQVEAVLQRYQTVHDRMVAAPTYRAVSETAAGALQVVHNNFLYRFFLRSLTEPTLTRIMATDVFQVVKNHFAPTAMPAALEA